MFLFDTNIFLEYLLGQSKANICEKALTLVSKEREGWVTSFSLHAIEAILSSKNKDKALINFLEFFDEHPYFYCYTTTLNEEIEIAKMTKKTMMQKSLDFDDSLQYYVAKKQSLILVTLDKDFKNIKGDVVVATPADIVDGVI